MLFQFTDVLTNLLNSARTRHRSHSVEQKVLLLLLLLLEVLLLAEEELLLLFKRKTVRFNFITLIYGVVSRIIEILTVEWEWRKF